jgi:cyclopropane-fatty-acyl-phospholipid synthase
MPDQRYDSYRKRPDFINQYIFPGGCCPSLTALCNAATRDSTFVVEHLDNIGPHYAPTLQIWRDNFINAWPKIYASAPHKYDDVFKHKWIYYFDYCRIGFQTRTLENLRILWTRPTNVETLGIVSIEK